jgi:glucuronoarabinoxylan endo-1,4-beta-xylanase
MFHRLTENLFRPFRRPHSFPGSHGARAGLRLESLESRLVPSTISWNQEYQTIDGFGASSAWIVQNLTPAQANLLYSPTQGIGLSILRSRIRPDTSAWSDEVNTMKTAQSLGVTVWSTPWSPPAEWKDNGSVDNGGHLLASHYQDYADLLSQYVRNMQAQGITIHAVSIANEPNWTASYESSRWTASEFAAFLPVLADTFARDGVTAQILLPEETSWNFELANDIFNDPTLAADVGIVAGHNYGGTISPVPQAQGKGLWETETSSSEAFDPSINNAIRWAKNIHDFMTVAHADAWHYWWIHSLGNDDAGLLGPNWQLTKRSWAVGNYSRFVRPGWVDIGATDDGSVLISAYKDPASDRFAIVAVNQGNAVTETFNLHGFVTRAVAPWVTSADLDLAQQARIAVHGRSFTADLPAQSVTTFVGTAIPFDLTAIPFDSSGSVSQVGPGNDGAALAGVSLGGTGFTSSAALPANRLTASAYPLASVTVLAASGQTGASVPDAYGMPALPGPATFGDQGGPTFNVPSVSRTSDPITGSLGDWAMELPDGWWTPS